MRPSFLGIQNGQKFAKVNSPVSVSFVTIFIAILFLHHNIRYSNYVACFWEKWGDCETQLT